MNKYTKIFIFSFFVILVIAGFYFYNNSSNYNLPSFNETKELIERASKKIITPSPLTGPIESTIESDITVSGIIAETNKHRSKYELEPLVLNLELSEAAEMKVEDMFTGQYFEHISPTGQGPDDLINRVGYEYLVIGENLILGNYENNSALVQAWMDSPGHRDNILNSNFKEIGVSAEKGNYEGSSVWIAVQEFGRSASDCPEISYFLELQIDENQQLLEKWAKELDEKKNNLNRRPGASSQNKTELDEYNQLVSRYNELLEETKRLMDEYNRQVEAYNLCIQ
jgi:uncharacterized protein YkwD